MAHPSPGRAELPYLSHGFPTQLFVSCGAQAKAEARLQPGIMSTFMGLDTILAKRAPARNRPWVSGQGRARLSRAERRAVQVVAVAVAGFCGYGFATGSP